MRKIDVWDFGAEVLDEDIYNNMLSEAVMNEYFGKGYEDGSTEVSISDVFIDFDKDGIIDGKDLMFCAGGKFKHRIRTVNTNVTRFDEEVKTKLDENGVAYKGCVYSNSAPNPDVHVALYFEKNDIINVVVGTNGNATQYCFETLDGKYMQSYMYQVRPKITAATAQFYAPESGIYKIYCPKEKLVIARITREHTEIRTIKGKLGEEYKDSYQLIFVNEKTNERIPAQVNNKEYIVELNEKYPYKLEVINEDGLMVSREDEYIFVENDMEKNVSFEKYEIINIKAAIVGVDKEFTDKVQLIITPADSSRRFVPVIRGNNFLYDLCLEKGCEYNIEAKGVNDYSLNKKIIKADSDKENVLFDFDRKQLYDIELILDSCDKAELESVTFTHRYEDGYSYTFKKGENIKLRSGQYKIIVKLVDESLFAQEVLYTKDCIVADRDTSCVVPVKMIPGRWIFEELAKTNRITDSLAGLKIDGEVQFNKDKYLCISKGGKVSFPVKKEQRITVNFCFMGAFMTEGAGLGPKPVFEHSETTAYDDTRVYYAKEDGIFSITGINGVSNKGTGVWQTFITSILVDDMVEYNEVLKVGANEKFKTINAALSYVQYMKRDDRRVTILIEPGNYEEMLVIKEKNITLKNISKTPDIKLYDKGRNIGADGVRITGYYGHGYAYYSMKDDCKYDERMLEVNKANGILGFENPGTGLRFGSYWNSTVVVYADGFEAEGIIFENSFNQYVSKKESNDVKVALSGAKGDRIGLCEGNVCVQQRAFVERAAAVALANGMGKAYFKDCCFVGRQDTLFGGSDSVVLFDKCSIMGGCDYIFGPMTACFKECELVLNISDESNDIAYITAAQQPEDKQGYFMHKCIIRSTVPNVETASEKQAKPSYFGRPWSTVSQVVFNETIIGTTEYNGIKESVILKEGWIDSLGGKTFRNYEYKTVEESGEDNSSNRADWVKINIADDEFIKKQMDDFEKIYSCKIF